MGIAELLTILFIILKLTGIIHWGWFLVLLPEIIAVSFYVIFYLGIGGMMIGLMGFALRTIHKEERRSDEHRRRILRRWEHED